MKIEVIKENCIGCGACQAIAPSVFEITDEGVSEVKLDEIPEELEEETMDAIEGCPTSAIENVEK